MKKSTLFFLVIFILLGACSPKTVELPAPEVLSGANSQPQEAIDRVESQPVQEGEILLTEGNLAVTVFSPADNSIVSTSQVEVRGVSNTETVMTINGLLCLLSANQEFSYPVDLEEGYNTIELVASDYEGNQVELILTVILEM